MTNVTSINSCVLFERLKSHCEPLGLEPYMFKLSWYNELVDPPFRFDYDGNTVCAVIISTPSYFEQAFLPYLKATDSEKCDRDPVDSCTLHHVDEFQKACPDVKMTAMFDFELLPSRRPKVLVQTAAHVSGAAYYYQRKSVSEKLQAKEENGKGCNKEEGQFNSDPWGDKRIFGVCIHPKYGGWFSVRSVIIFHDVFDPALPYIPPIDCVPSKEARIKLLDSLNFHWEDGAFRDIIPVQDRYSDLQREYFSTLPKDRKKLIEKKFNI